MNEAAPNSFVPFWLSGAAPPKIAPARVTRAWKKRYYVLPSHSIEARELQELRAAEAAELGSVDSDEPSTPM